jgi:hypothetical protein
MIMTLPNFIVIGAYKSGTTSLYNYLRQHPEIFMSRIKEPNFFAHEKKAKMMREEGKEVRVIDNMDSYQDLFKKVTNEKAIGEASPIYLGTPLAAKRIKETIPDVKLIAILRQPVDAFYSDHNMRIRESRKLENDFRERFMDIENRIRSGKISGPMYYSQLKTYYDLFDASQIKVYLFEDLIKNSSAVFQDIFRFLGVDDTFRPDMSETYNPGGLPKNQKLGEILTNLLKKKKLIKKVPFLRKALLRLQQANTVKFPPLSPDLRRELTSIFREDIQNLQKLIGRDMNAWLK